MSAKLSRPKRWAAAIERAREAVGNIESACMAYNDAMSELKDLQAEYQEWQNNLPENLQGSNLNEKLEAISNLDLEGADDNIDVSELESRIEEAEGAELPQGFGRD